MPPHEHHRCLPEPRPHAPIRRAESHRGRYRHLPCNLVHGHRLRARRAEHQAVCRSGRMQATKAQGYITSGERDGQSPTASTKALPFEYMARTSGNRSLHTTNGRRRSKALVRSGSCSGLSSLSPLSPRTQRGRERVLAICSGWKAGSASRTRFRRRARRAAPGPFEIGATRRAARDLTPSRRTTWGYLADAAHVKRLARLSVVKDIDFCLTQDKYPVVPRLENGVLVA